MTTTNRDLIREYLSVTVPGTLDPDRARRLLHDYFVHVDPMGGADSADAFVGMLRQYADAPSMPMSSEVLALAEGDDGTVAAFTELTIAPGVVVTYAHWYTVEVGRIRRAQVIYDPRPFLELAAGAPS